jgi:uncharacterized protein
MPTLPHAFVWYELMTTNMDAAEAFYGAVVGWSPQSIPQPDMRYTVMKAGDRMVAGVMALPADAREAGARPGWVGYVGTDDADASTRKLREAGGMVHREPADIPDIGRFSVVADPQGPCSCCSSPWAATIHLRLP